MRSISNWNHLNNGQASTHHQQGQSSLHLFPAYLLPQLDILDPGCSHELGREIALARVSLFLGGFGSSIRGIVMVYRIEGQTGGWKPIALSLPCCYDDKAVPCRVGAADSSPVFTQRITFGGPRMARLCHGRLAGEVRCSELRSPGEDLLVAVAYPAGFPQGGDHVFDEWGFGTMLFWLFVPRMAAISVLMAWLYNSNRRSILSAVLLHFAYDFTFGFVYPIPESTHLFGTFLILIMTVAVVVIWRDQRMTRQRVFWLISNGSSVLPWFWVSFRIKSQGGRLVCSHVL